MRRIIPASLGTALIVACANPAPPRDEAELGAAASSEDDAAERDTESLHGDAGARPEVDATRESASSATLGSDVDARADLDARVAFDSDADAGGRDAEAGAPDADTCNLAQSALSAYLTEHGSCSTDADCVTLGSCSPAHWDAVAREAAEGASPLFSAVSSACSARLGFDGPISEAFCAASGRCDIRQGGHWCGERLPPAQPARDITRALRQAAAVHVKIP